jgi:hypothetical protein
MKLLNDRRYYKPITHIAAMPLVLLESDSNLGGIVISLRNENGKQVEEKWFEPR